MGHARVGSSRQLNADGVLLGITAFWGLTFVIVKDALAHADTMSFLALRFGVGALALTAIARGQMLWPENLRRGVLLATFLFAGFTLQTAGLRETTPSRSAFITGMCVVLVPLVSIAVFRRLPRVASLVGVMMSAVGLWVLTSGEEANGPAQVTRGDWLTLASAASYAIHITLTEKYAPREGTVGLVAVQLWVVSLLSALSLTIALPHVEWTAGFVGAVLFCALFASALAISAQTWAQARTSAVRAAIIYALEPVFAAAYSVALGRERLGVREVAGGALIVLGVLAAELGGALVQRLRLRGRMSRYTRA